MTRLRNYTAIVALVAAVVVDAHTMLRSSATKHTEAAPLKANATKNPCAAWLQQVSGQAPGVVAAAGPPPCPCLATPPPLMSPEENQAAEVKAAADNAMLLGLTRIQEAAGEASAPMLVKIKALNSSEVSSAADGAFTVAEDNQTANLRMMLGTEKARQTKELADMESGTNLVAQLSASHLRQTAEQWANNQAKNSISIALNGTMNNAMNLADYTASIRQEATELTKGAITSAAQALAVAKKAQEAIAYVPEKQMLAAVKHSAQSAEEQVHLNKNMEALEGSIRATARTAGENYAAAFRTLRLATDAEKVAREALEQSRANALKIEKLKLRAQKVGKKAKEAKAAFLDSLK